jgi:hypothetical protein
MESACCINEKNKETYPCLYYTFICVLGISLLFTLIYGLTLSNETISNNMLTYIPYRITLSTCILLQMGVWTLCLYSKRNVDYNAASWGFVVMCLVTFSWVGLSTILIGEQHFIFVGLFMASFLVSTLILCSLTWQEEAVHVLKLCVLFTIICDVSMMILFNNGKFYIMEHVAFISYSIVFISFFLIHPPSEWGIMPENHPLEYAINDDSIEWYRGDYSPVMMPHSYPMVYTSPPDGPPSATRLQVPPVHSRR